MLQTAGRPSCPDCAAPLDSAADRCWLCHQRTGEGPKTSARERSRASAPREAKSAAEDISQTGGILLPALFLLFVGLALEGWGTAAIALVFCSPVYLTLVLAKAFGAPPRDEAREASEPKTAPQTRTLRDAADIVFKTLAVAALIFIAIIVALCVTCSFIIGLGR